MLLKKSNYDSLNTKQKLIFLAGVFEGEGSFGFWGKINKERKYFKAQVEMTDKDIVLRFYNYFKFGFLTENKVRFNYKKSWTWRVSGEQAIKIVLQLLPYLGIRRQEKFNLCYPSYKPLPHLRKSYLTQLIKQLQTKTLQLN